MQAFFAAVQVLPWNTSVATAYGTLRARLAAGGKTLSALEMLIAGHTFALGATLVTHDEDFLQASAFLRTTDWATDL